MDDLPFPLAAENDVPADTIYEIGALIVSAAIADFGLGNQLIRLVSGQRAPLNLRISPLVTGMDFKVKLAMVRIFATTIPDAAIAQRAHKICDRLQEVYQRRNDVTHLVPSGHSRGVTKFMVMKRNGKTGLPPQPKTYTKHQIRSWSRELDSLVIDLSEILDDYQFSDVTDDED